MADNNLTTASSVKEDAVSATRPSAHASEADATSTPAVKSGVKRPGDRIFEFLSTASATLITVMIAAIAAFLIWRAVPSLSVNEGGILGFFTYGDRWETNDTDAMKFGIPTMFGHTVLISIVALIIAMPVALGIAIFLSNYAPAKLVKPLGFLVDMLAAVPSIVYGLWGWQVLGPALSGFYTWLHSWAGGFFLFKVYDNSPNFATGRNVLTGGIVLAVMILPIIAATAREVFVQTPPGQIESALALGATRWEVIRMTVLPFGMSGYIAGSMLGLGRALGETMALYMVVSPLVDFRFSLFDGGTTFATAIALAAAEFGNEMRAGAYIAAGLMLFLLTFLVNAIARSIVKSK
ncbi:phosphate ABC transporter permease subunit PstC [Corynebacterium aurimucosum]|uniref:Phosphate transport system permease protein n=1 Tax=Corynebacterium intestinale TaxID=2943492 RepID=A0ABT0TAM8_9CORY|nr:MULTISPECIES: phosphate ABC transporter permease subunit PstC [Corynebacterium]MBE7339412.1 phosphate ABC transporter permease subunit PstC [Corynebacterium aurimucosum]MBE7365490.1 phosphate ABC transporter permease subunit PstC [Corynebacterium aurimucosum]MCG7262038.1 phosphate ABC transporter permease subunit PstC [Corynebacterium aurimucosum]MCL8494128.1 phosphate ABC transporter permease subunit PstC [Corynebacterium intestinale]MCP1390364.1 phosphate ABC transporter permease subunit 